MVSLHHPTDPPGPRGRPPTSPGMVLRRGAKRAFPPSPEPGPEAAPSSSCCQLAGQTESCYCKDRDHAEPHACPCRKVPRGHLSDTRPASGAGAKGSPPGAVWPGRPALNCRVQSCSWSEAISSEALGRVYIPGMSIPFPGGTEQRQEHRNNIWTLVTCDQQHPPANGRNIQLAGAAAACFPLCRTPSPGAEPSLPQLQDGAGGRCYKCTGVSLALPSGSRATHFGNKGQRRLEGPPRDVKQIGTFPSRADACPAVSPMWWPQAEGIALNVPPSGNDGASLLRVRLGRRGPAAPAPGRRHATPQPSRGTGSPPRLLPLLGEGQEQGPRLPVSTEGPSAGSSSPL